MKTLQQGAPSVIKDIIAGGLSSLFHNHIYYAYLRELLKEVQALSEYHQSLMFRYSCELSRAMQKIYAMDFLPQLEAESHSKVLPECDRSFQCVMPDKLMDDHPAQNE